MQDISLMPQWNRELALQNLSKSPLDHKLMRHKLDRIYQISPTNELQYVPDVIDAYSWIRLANEESDFKQYCSSPKAYRYFIEQFIASDIRYLVICKKFKNKVLMVLTQQTMIESLKFVKKNIQQIHNHPKMAIILKYIFNPQQSFYKLNYIIEQPQINLKNISSDEFINNLKIGDEVDFYSIDTDSKVNIWLTGIIKKIGNVKVYCIALYDNCPSITYLKNYTICPKGTMQKHYNWRYNLNKGDQIDYISTHREWAVGTILQRKTIEMIDQAGVKRQKVKLLISTTDNEEGEWQNITSSRILKRHTLLSEDMPKIYQRVYSNDVQDWNDNIYDPDCEEIFHYRECKSKMLLDLIKYAHHQLKLFQDIKHSIVNKKVSIEVIGQLVAFISLIQQFMHRKYAMTYLKELSESLFEYFQKSQQSVIRKFSNERYEIIIEALTEFTKRYMTAQDCRRRIEQFQLCILLRFLFSQFLDRKLQALNLLTYIMKSLKHSIRFNTKQQILKWINNNKILSGIYNQKSHSQLINRSSDFLHLYLMLKPNIQQLNCLLQWNDNILKLISQQWMYFPNQFKQAVITMIKNKQNVINFDALKIIRNTSDCQSWLLKNGGQFWVVAMKEKSKRKNNIIQVFKQPFNVVYKITAELAQDFQSKLKNEFFIYMHDINYVADVFKMELPLQKKIQFAHLAIEPLNGVNQTVFQAILPFTRKVDQIKQKQLAFFNILLMKLSNKQIKLLFDTNYTQKSDLENMGQGQITLFIKSIQIINENMKKIQKKYVYESIKVNSYKKEKKTIITVQVNPNQLFGMKQLMQIIFRNKDINVTQIALQFITFLFEHLAQDLQTSAIQFKQKFLQSCLEQFYKTQDQQQKYMKIISKLMNESQKEGCDKQPSVNAMFPIQTIHLRLIDHFNVNKTKMIMQVKSNITLYELRHQIGRIINAHIHQMKIMLQDKLLESNLNGYVIHQLNLNSGDLIIEKKVTIEKAMLLNSNRQLSQKLKYILSNIFKEYSHNGLMSKIQFQKLHQRCVGQVTAQTQMKINSYYEQYDKDKDGYLTQQNFLQFYENSVKMKQTAVWANLQNYGIRNDLQILTNKQIQYVDGMNLTRNLLYKNQKFIKLLLKLLHQNNSIGQSAWDIISRLPIIQFNKNQLDLSRKYVFRYWLYLMDYNRKYDLLTEQMFNMIINSDIQSMCIGLKVIQQHAINGQVFNKIFSKLKIIKKQKKLDFYNKVILDNCLKIIDNALKDNLSAKQHYIEHYQEYNSILLLGLMSKNQQIRNMFCQCIETIMQYNIHQNTKIFQIMFNMVYKNFNNCDKQKLHIQYFDLYSNLIEKLNIYPHLLDKLKLNWNILTESMIQLYKMHSCTQTSLNSPPDEVSQGFLRIINKLLNQTTVNKLVPLVGFIFKNNLFSDLGSNKLKNSKSRKDAYELIYQICKFKSDNGQSLGLNELFNSGFKDVYRKVSKNKPNYSSFSYFYNYNQARSQLGYAGIRNLGCICYMLSMLQQLFMTQPFKNLILMADDNQPECIVKYKNKQIDDNIFHQLKKMFANLQLTQKQQYDPTQFCYAFKDFQGQSINVAIQQDAQEFLNIFFDKLQSSLKNTPFRRIFQNIYGGRTCSQTVCSNCKAIKERQENFYPLSLEIKGYRNIEQSFKKFIQGQVISDYQCDFCNEKTDVTKSCYLSTTPNYFIIHLQRMCFNYDKYQNQKVNSRWQFPMNLNVYNYSLDKQKQINQREGIYQYTLKGIVVHYGSAQFGHYFSYIKQNQTQWIEFNDQRVRQFDPRDIEIQCFGGDHWRRECQNAYLLLYQRAKKSPVILQFKNQVQKSKILSQFKLHNCVIDHLNNQTKQQQNLDCQNSQQQLLQQVQKQDYKENKQKNQEQKYVNEKQKQEQVLEQKQNKPIEKQTIIQVKLDLLQIPMYLPQNLKQVINKANEQFSFTINLNNDEFGQFLYRILSIEPPQSLNSQYLELCYHCFHLKQNIQDQNSGLLSQWATTRFRKIIKGHGWKFMPTFMNNLQNDDLFSHEKNTRVSAQNLIECVLSDIIQSSQLNTLDHIITQPNQTEQTVSQQYKLVLKVLNKLLQMLRNQVQKFWTRFKNYFELWCHLINKNPFVRKWASQKIMVKHILDFVLEEDSPFSRLNKRYPMGQQNYPAEFQYPLEVMTLLIKYGYQLNEQEKKCLKKYPFISKIINYPIKHFNLIEYICKDNQIISQKMAYLILTDCIKVNESSSIKPIIAAIHQFLAIKDEYSQLRLQWIIGYPVYISNQRTKSFGVYQILPEQQMIAYYVSPIRAQPIMQHIIRFKTKSTHVTALLYSMLLQLEADGYINNLEEYPSVFAFKENYLRHFDGFVQSYHNETHRSFMAQQYMDYGQRLQRLWNNRPHREYNNYKRYLIGKNMGIQQVEIKLLNELPETIKVSVSDVTSALLELNESNKFLNYINIKNFQKNQNFKPKLSTQLSTYQTMNSIHNGIHKFSSVRPCDNSSDEQITQINKELEITSNPFDKAIEGKLLKENLCFVIKIVDPHSNIFFCSGEISCEIHRSSQYTLTLMKKDIDVQSNPLQIGIKIIGKATTTGYWPRQLITPVEDDRSQHDKSDSDEESDD